VYHGDTINGNIEIRNLSSKPIYLESARKTCTCQKINYTSGTIATGKSKYIAYHIDTKKLYPGKYSATVYMSLRHRNKRHFEDCKIVLDIKPEEIIHPPSIDFGLVSKADFPLLKTITIEDVGKEPLQKPNLAVSSSFLRVLNIRDEAKSVLFDIELRKPISSAELIRETITADVNGRIYRIPVRARIQQQLSLYRTRFIVGPCATGERRTINIRGKMSPGTDILSIKTSSTNVELQANGKLIKDGEFCLPLICKFASVSGFRTEEHVVIDYINKSSKSVGSKTIRIVMLSKSQQTQTSP
jgi:hypothetical protein